MRLNTVRSDYLDEGKNIRVKYSKTPDPPPPEKRHRGVTGPQAKGRSFLSALSVVFAALAFFALAGNAGAQVQCPDPPDDKQTLLSIKETFDPNGVLNWNSSLPFVQWNGFSRNNHVVNDRAVMFTLLYKDLEGGEIPPKFGCLTELTHLSLRSSKLSGTLPSELGNLGKLENLDLVENNLSGSIEVLGGLAKITEIELQSNQFTGTIPIFENAAEITGLYLNDNKLTGLGDPAGWKKLTSLTRLYLNDNRLTGHIPDLSALTRLTRLYLNDNQLTGHIPDLSALTRLTHLSLNNNRLSGEIPTELGQLTALRFLYLWDNELTGTIPTELGNLTNLVELSLSRNMLSGKIPTELGQLTALQFLYLWDNELTGKIPTELGTLISLTELSLSRNMLSGEIPDLSALMTNLEGLYLNNNRLSGEIPTELGQLTALRFLYLRDNELTGTIPTELGNLTNLVELSLSRNMLSGEIPDLSALTRLTHLYLDNNRLSGSIPDLSALTSLVRLYLNQNNLSGEIPASLGDLTSLTHLYLSGNQLSGSVPMELENLVPSQNPVLEEFALWGNDDLMWNGISDELGKRVDRAALRVLHDRSDGRNWEKGDGWSLSAPAPLFSFSDWYGVTVNDDGRVAGLDLSNNNLKGEITSGLEALDGLTTLNFSGNNKLSGTLPLGLTDLPLERLNIQCTGIGTPTDADFQTWLGGINFTGSRCPSFRPPAHPAPPAPAHPAPPAPEPPEDLEELKALYWATGGESWVKSTDWLSDEPLSDWHGVTVNGQGRVTGLDLSRNGLSGELPLVLMDLSELETLDIGDTDACAPGDEEFQRWLGTIMFRGDNCGGGGCAIVSDGRTGNAPESAVLNLLLMFALIVRFHGRVGEASGDGRAEDKGHRGMFLKIEGIRSVTGSMGCGPVLMRSAPHRRFTVATGSCGG